MNIKTKIIDTSIEMKPLQYAKDGDAGIDLIATSKSYDGSGNVVYGTNRAFEIPDGYVGLLFPRSSNSKTNLVLSNSVGVLDSGYRGEVLFKFKSTIRSLSLLSLIKLIFKRNCNKLYVHNEHSNSYDIGDRIGQLVIIPYPKVAFEETQDLSNTERGDNGFGSTGK